MKCNICNLENPDGAIFCNHCGTKTESEGKTCPNKSCNRANLPEEAIFCPDCGTPLRLDEADITVKNKTLKTSNFTNENTPFENKNKIKSETSKPVLDKKTDNKENSILKILDAIGNFFIEVGYWILILFIPIMLLIRSCS